MTAFPPLLNLATSIIPDYTNNDSDILNIVTSYDDSLPIGTIYSDRNGVKIIVCPALPGLIDDKEKALSFLKEDNGKSKIYVQEAGDGTLIRLFSHNNQWKLATNQSLTLDSVNLSLNQKQTFKSMFDTAADSFEMSKLDTNQVYFFLLEHPENIIIVQHKTPNLRFIASIKVNQSYPYYCCETLNFTHPFLENHINAFTPENALKNYETFINNNDEQVLLSKPVEFVGLIITEIMNDGTIARYRLESNEYRSAKELRGVGTLNDRRFKIMTILCGSSFTNEEKENKLKQFINVFPNYLALVKELNSELERLYSIVFDYYMMCFKNNQRDKVNPGFIKFLYKIQNELFIPFIKPNRMSMTKDSIVTFILKQDAKQVMHLLNLLKKQ